jgi:hypothetical protein
LMKTHPKICGLLFVGEQQGILLRRYLCACWWIVAYARSSSLAVRRLTLQTKRSLPTPPPPIRHPPSAICDTNWGTETASPRCAHVHKQNGKHVYYAFCLCTCFSAACTGKVAYTARFYSPATTAVQVSIDSTSPHTDGTADVAGDITAAAAAAAGAIATLYPMNDPAPDPELERLAAAAWRDASAV